MHFHISTPFTHLPLTTGFFKSWIENPRSKGKRSKSNKTEPVSKGSILSKLKEGENFNRRRHEVSALVNI
jgi:hypothetical protein